MYCKTTTSLFSQHFLIQRVVNLKKK